MSILEQIEVPFSIVVASGCSTIVLASALAYILMQPSRSEKSGDGNEPIIEEPEEKKVVDKEKYPGGEIYVYYGTQTGTAESFARELEREGPDNGFLVHVADLEDIEAEQFVEESRKDVDLHTSRGIFLMATYGEGEPPDNSTMLYQAFREKAGYTTDEGNAEEEKKESDNGAESEPDATFLLGLEYCVFGLGNREYDHYNAMGVFFDDVLHKLGGSRILELGLGDDNDDLEADFEKWKEQLWPALKKLYVKDTKIIKKRINKASQPDCLYEAIYYDQQNGVTSPLSTETSSSPSPSPGYNVNLEQVHSSSKHFFTSVDCPVKCFRELRNASNDMGSTFHMEIDISKVPNHKKDAVRYQTADNFGILPQNRMEDVVALAKAFDFDLDAVFSLKASPNHEWNGIPFPMPISIRECLLRYCDITIAPRRSDLKLLAAHCRDPLDEKALLRMSSKEGKVEYKQKILNGHIGLVQLLKLCPSIKFDSLEAFLTFIPLLHPRYYTISSSSSRYPDTVHLTVALTEAAREDGTVFHGVCTGYLKNLKAGVDTIRAFNRSSTFRLPEDPLCPILMIGPGTGIAPMRALLQEREYMKETKKLEVIGQNILYFGCKRKDQDYLYKEELAKFQDDGILNQLHVAFSREGPTKVYVQHLLAQNATATWELIHKMGAYIYVCGGVKMGHDVGETLKQIFADEGKISPDEARDYLQHLSKEGRFVQELWA